MLASAKHQHESAIDIYMCPLLLEPPSQSTPLKERIVLIFDIHCYGLPWWLSGKESACNTGDAGDRGLILGLGKSPGIGNGNPLQCSYRENPMDRSLAGYSPWGHKRVERD